MYGKHHCLQTLFLLLKFVMSEKKMSENLRPSHKKKKHYR